MCVNLCEHILSGPKSTCQWKMETQPFVGLHVTNPVTPRDWWAASRFWFQIPQKENLIDYSGFTLDKSVYAQGAESCKLNKAVKNFPK